MALLHKCREFSELVQFSNTKSHKLYKRVFDIYFEADTSTAAARAALSLQLPDHFVRVFREYWALECKAIDMDLVAAFLEKLSTSTVKRQAMKRVMTKTKSSAIVIQRLFRRVSTQKKLSPQLSLSDAESPVSSANDQDQLGADEMMEFAPEVKPTMSAEDVKFHAGMLHFFSSLK